MIISRKSSAMANKGYGCEFVEAPPDYIVCKVCTLYLREPQITECCGKTLCLPCVQAVQQHSSGEHVCPFCKNPGLKGILNRGMRKDILERKVYCTSKKGGCNWVGSLEVLEKHNKECGYTVINCTSKCGTRVKRHDLKAHLQSCKRYRLSCKCGEVIERRQQDEHAKECPLTKIKCPFSIVGCSVEVLNKDLQSHYDVALPDHLAMVNKQSSSVQTQLKQAKHMVVSKQAKNTQQLDGEIQKLSNAINKAEERVGSLENVIQTTEVEIAYLEEECRKSQNANRAEIARKNAEIQALLGQVYAVQMLSKVKTFGIPVVRYGQVFSRPTAPTTQEFVPPIKFIVPKFTEKVNNDELWLSPPFFTYRRGYKMCLQVYCNGYDQRARSKWLSLYVTLVKGEYDQSLQWPFTGSLVVQITNQIKNNRHIVKTFNFSADNILGKRVTDGYFGKGENTSGYWNFVTQSVLFPSSLTIMPEFKYVVNDSIEICVNKVSVY